MAVPTKTGNTTNQSLPARIGRYFREVRSELRKVVWPTRQELITYTIVVLATVAIVSLFLGVVDIAVSELLTLLASLGR